MEETRMSRVGRRTLYPRVGTTYEHPGKACPCSVTGCSHKTRTVLRVQVSWFRDDDAYLVCPAHATLAREDLSAFRKRAHPIEP
jgi:hypothetical protein